MTLYIGGVLGGSEVRETPFFSTLMAVSQVIERESAKLDVGESSIDLVFHMPGSLIKPDYEGLRTGKFSKREKTLMVQVAVPVEQMTSDSPAEFIFSMAREAIAISRVVFKKAKITFDDSAYQRLLLSAQNRLASSDID